MGLAATSQRAVKQWIGRHGETLTHRRTTGATYDPATGKTSAGTTTDTVLVGARREVRSDEIDGTLVLAGDQIVQVAGKDLTVTPAVDDTMVIDGEEWRVMRVMSRRLSGLVVQYDLQVRQ